MDHALLERGLPKWPALLVKGEKISEEEAAEVLIRTNGVYIGGNDRALNKQLYDAFGCKQWKETIERDDMEPYEIDKIDYAPFNEKWKMLDLSYMRNDRIVSAWIGGPHGWCDWDGKIFAANYNIGKWPSCEEVYEDWQKIAEAFPFLNLTAQLLPMEIGEAVDQGPGLQPVIEFRVKKGEVEVRDPEDICVFPQDLDMRAVALSFGFGREREFAFRSLEEFKEKLTIVEKRLGV